MCAVELDVIEADLKNLCGGSVACDMTSEFPMRRVRAHDHSDRIPANDCGDPRLHIEVARKRALPLERDGVSIRAKGQQVGYDAKILRLPAER
jgi:hypothetical protein